MGGLADEDERFHFLNSYHHKFEAYTRNAAPRFDATALDNKLADFGLEVSRVHLTAYLKDDSMPITAALHFLLRHFPDEYQDVIDPIWPKLLISPGFGHSLKILLHNMEQLKPQVADYVKRFKIVPSKLRYDESFRSVMGLAYAFTPAFGNVSYPTYALESTVTETPLAAGRDTSNARRQSDAALGSTLLEMCVCALCEWFC